MQIALKRSKRLGRQLEREDYLCATAATFPLFSFSPPIFLLYFCSILIGPKKITGDKGDRSYRAGSFQTASRSSTTTSSSPFHLSDKQEPLPIRDVPIVEKVVQPL